MTHEDSDGGMPDLVGGVVDWARDGIGSIGDAVGGLVEHVTPDGINPFSGGGPGGVVPDVVGQLADPEVAVATVDLAVQVIVP